MGEIFWEWLINLMQAREKKKNDSWQNLPSHSKKKGKTLSRGAFPPKQMKHLIYGEKWGKVEGEIKIDICLELSPLLSHKAVNRSFHFWYQARWAETKKRGNFHSFYQSINRLHLHVLSLSLTHVKIPGKWGWRNLTRCSKKFECLLMTRNET